MYRKKTLSILQFLIQNKLISHIQDNAVFWDEPFTYYFSTPLARHPQTLINNDLTVDNFNNVAGGLSFFAPEEALIKCVGEAIERISLGSYNKNSITNKILSPDEQKIWNLSSSQELGVVSVPNLITQKNVYVPAQQIYLNYAYTEKEKNIYPIISTGAACSTNNESAIVSGILEVIERDAVMCMYLTKISPTRIDTLTVKNNQIEYIDQLLKRYHLQWYLYNVSCDTKIPVYLSIIVDLTGSGCTLTVGSKAEFNHYEAIIGSVSEALMARPAIRSLQMNDTIKKNHTITNIDERLLYWADSSMLEHISFILDAPETSFNITKHRLTDENKLSFLLKLFSQKNFNVFSIDITPDLFKTTHLKVYKSLIPELQPLYLDEQEKYLHTPRLQQYAQYFGTILQTTKINTIPHPFA